MFGFRLYLKKSTELTNARKCTALTMQEVLTMKRFSKHLMHCIMHTKIVMFKKS